MILKIDCEDCEWNVFIKGSSQLSRFRSIIAEFHWLDLVSRHRRYLEAMKRVLANFTVVHAHECNHFPPKHFGNYSIPAVLEVTFVRNDLVATMTRCVNPPYLQELDHPEKVNTPDHVDGSAFSLPDVA